MILFVHKNTSKTEIHIQVATLPVGGINLVHT